MSGEIDTFLSSATTVDLPSPPITLDSFEVLSRSNSETLSPNIQGVPVAHSSTNEMTKRKHKHKHPLIRNMIDEAIFEKTPKGNKKGLSLAGIKKFLTEKYSLNIKHSARRIREHINESVQSGRYIQKTGRGANGSFRLSPKISQSFKKNKGKERKVARISKIDAKKELTADSPNSFKINIPRRSNVQRGHKRKAEMVNCLPTTPKVAKMGAI